MTGLDTEKALTRINTDECGSKAKGHEARAFALSTPVRVNPRPKINERKLRHTRKREHLTRIDADTRG
jgi:hypothetical protein